MSLNDVTSDMVARIRNAYMARLNTLTCNYSNLNKSVLEVLRNEGYIQDFLIFEDKKRQFLKVTLSYPMKERAIRKIEKISTPGRRVYKPVKNLTRSKNSLGISIVSTSRGVMSDHECIKHNLGGEIICTVF